MEQKEGEKSAKEYCVCSFIQKRFRNEMLKVIENMNEKKYIIFTSLSFSLIDTSMSNK